MNQTAVDRELNPDFASTDLLGGLSAEAVGAIDAWDKYVVLAHVCEHAGRYDDMKEYMKERVLSGPALLPEERDSLSAAFKGAVSRRREAWQTARLIEEEYRREGKLNEAYMAENYRTKLAAELQEVCNELLELLENTIVPKCESGEPKTFYLKLQADYHRYIVESTDGMKREKAIEKAKEYYSAATKEAGFNLLTTHPVRLSLALNYSVFKHEVLNDREGAIAIAHAAHSGAFMALEGMPEECHRDAADEMALLHDNLALWREE